MLTWTSQAQPQCVQIQKAWLGGVVPAVTDDESSVQDKALECLDRLLLQSIQHHSEGRDADGGQALAHWPVLVPDLHPLCCTPSTHVLCPTFRDFSPPSFSFSLVPSGFHGTRGYRFPLSVFALKQRMYVSLKVH